MNIMERLNGRIHEMGNPTVAGLDTKLEFIPEAFIRANASEGIRTTGDAAHVVFEYNKKLIDGLCDIVPAVKVQAAYYEMYGVDGMQAFAKTLRYASEHGLIVMADAKRNDIGSTAACYADAYLGETAIGDGVTRAFEADILTVNPYLGIDGIKPFVDVCTAKNKGIFALVKTSNPSSGQLQDLKFEDGRTLYETVADYLEVWGEETRGASGYSVVGAVVGATYPEQGAALRSRMPHTFFLVPGYGAQGATGKDIAGCFDKMGGGAIVNASRSILCAWKKKNTDDFVSAACEAASAMREDLRSSILANR